MLQHFYLTTSEKQATLLKETWNKCIEELQSGKLQLPVLKVKLYEDGKLTKVLKNEGNFLKSISNKSTSFN